MLLAMSCVRQVTTAVVAACVFVRLTGAAEPERGGKVGADSFTPAEVSTQLCIAWLLTGEPPLPPAAPTPLLTPDGNHLCLDADSGDAFACSSIEAESRVSAALMPGCTIRWR